MLNRGGTIAEFDSRDATNPSLWTRCLARTLPEQRLRTVTYVDFLKNPTDADTAILRDLPQAVPTAAPARPRADFSNVQAGASTAVKPPPEPAKPEPEVYTVVAGDSLSKIAKRAYGAVRPDGHGMRADLAGGQRTRTHLGG